jgi:thioredoxin-dependent peroxiredoxin
VGEPGASDIVDSVQELRIGDPAPPFTLLDQDGEKVRLADFDGRKLLLYFYPAADTPG